MGLREAVGNWFGRQAQAAAVVLSEAAMASGAYDPDSALTAAQMGSSYVKRLTSDNSRDLSPITQQRSLDLSYWMYDANPMAKRIVDATKDAVVGQGIQVVATSSEKDENEQLQRVLDEFWSDDINHMDMTTHQLCVDLSLAGELLILVQVNPANGSVRLGYVDTGLIGDVVPDPRFPQKAAAITLGGSRPATTKKLVLKVIGIDEDPNSKSFGRLMGARTGNAKDTPSGPVVIETYEFSLGNRGGKLKGVYDGSCFFFKINGVTSSRRGKPDLLCLIDWIDAFDNLLLNEVDRAVLLKSFIWDITIEGADEQMIREHLAKNPPPKANSIRAHNEKIQYKSDTPDLKAQDQSVLADQLLSYIATGAGLPKFWLNGSMEVNRATAKEMNDPASRHLATRRKYVKYIIERICNFVLDQAEFHGRISKRQEVTGTAGKVDPWPFEVQMPEAEKTEVGPLASALQAAVNATILAIQNQMIDIETGQRVIVMIFQQMGIEVDLDEMRQKIEKAVSEQAQQGEDEGGLSPEEYQALVDQAAQGGQNGQAATEALRG